MSTTLYDEAISLISAKQHVSTKLLQDNLLIGYNRACDLISRMEREGMVSKANEYGVRRALI